jgi:putative transposase
MALVELLQKSGDGDFLRSVAEAVLQILMEADVEGLIGASRHERSTDRLNYHLVARIGRLASGAGRCRTTAPSLTLEPLPCRSNPRQSVAATFRSSDTG